MWWALGPQSRDKQQERCMRVRQELELKRKGRTREMDHTSWQRVGNDMISVKPVSGELEAGRQLTFFRTRVTPPKKEGTRNFGFPGTFLDTCLIFALSKSRYCFFFFFIKYSSKQKKILESYVIQECARPQVGTRWGMVGAQMRAHGGGHRGRPTREQGEVWHGGRAHMAPVRRGARAKGAGGENPASAKPGPRASARGDAGAV